MMLSSLDNNALYTLYRDDPQGAGREAFNVLVARHHERLSARIAKRLSILTTSAEDITQNVFIQLMGQAHKFDPATGDVVGWMNWLADNRSKNEKRDRYRRPVLDTDYDRNGKKIKYHGRPGAQRPSIELDHNELEQFNIGTYAQGREQMPDFDATQEELVNAFWEFAETLEPHYRETLILVYVKGVSQTDTAKIQGIRRTTVMRRLHSILPKLHAAVGDDFMSLSVPLERRKSPRTESVAVCA